MTSPIITEIEKALYGVSKLDPYLYSENLVHTINAWAGTHEWVIITAVGSVNYNLQWASSDTDIKAMYLPTLHNLYFERCPIKSIVSDKVDLEIMPIHHFKKYMLKGNINFFEPVFSKDISIHASYQGSVFWDKMKFLVECNVAETCLHSYYTVINLRKNVMTDGNYNYKKATHCIRILKFLENLVDNNTFELYNVGEKRNLLMKIRVGEVSYEDFSTMYEMIDSSVRSKIFTEFGPKVHRFTDRVLSLDRTNTPEFKRTNDEIDEFLIERIKKG